MSRELDAAIFDFGGVLTTSVLESFAAFERSLGLPQGSLLKAFLHDRDAADAPYKLLEKGLMSEGEFYRLMFERLRDVTGLDLDLPEDPPAIRRRLFGELRPNERMIHAAARISTHYKTAILTNNVREWNDWRALAEAHRFHHVVDSSEVGMRKPDREIYLHTCEVLRVSPERAAFVDDIPDYVEAAAEVGLHAILFTTTDEVLAALEPLFPRAFASKEPSHA